MKKLFLSSFAILAIASSFAQTPKTVETKHEANSFVQAPVEAPAVPVVKAENIIKFKETVHDFGKIKMGVAVTYDFVFTNISQKTVVIESATASCGCTTPVKPELPIAKGKSDKIKAGFNAAAASPFDKTIYVKVSGAAQPMEIKIKGEVLSADAYAAYEATKKSGK